jgi:hypothetical protein
MEGGGGCRKFKTFVANLVGFAPPPPPEKVNFRHCTIGSLQCVRMNRRYERNTSILVKVQSSASYMQYRRNETQFKLQNVLIY